MNADGRNLRQITNTERMNCYAPSFSPDGKKIIFVRWHLKRERAFPLEGEMKTAWDVYEMDLATGTERRLTNYNFYQMSLPGYMPDGKHFLFTAEGPVNSTGKGPKNFEEYEKMYGKNFIFIMDGINNELKPAIINGDNSARPYVASDNSIIFVSETSPANSPKKTKELFLYRKGEITQLTKLGAYIRWGKISCDGSTIIFAKYDDQNSYIESLWLMKSDGTMLQEIKMPMNLLKQ
jgi:Tol biopolymer transport system component